MNEEDQLIIGKRVKLKPKEWYEEHNILSHMIPTKYYDDILVISGISPKMVVRLWKKGDGDITVPIDGFDFDPTDDRKISTTLHTLIADLKKFTYLFSDRNGTGGGRGTLFKTAELKITPCFDVSEGNECIELPAGEANITTRWNTEQLAELLQKATVQNVFSFSEWTTITDRLTIGFEEEKMPKPFNWAD